MPNNFNVKINVNFNNVKINNVKININSPYFCARNSPQLLLYEYDDTWRFLSSGRTRCVKNERHNSREKSFVDFCSEIVAGQSKSGRHGRFACFNSLRKLLDLKMIRRNRRFLVFCAAIFFAFQVYHRVKVVDLEASTTEQTFVFNSSACHCSRRVSLGHFGDHQGVNWCSSESSLRGKHQNVISYSIFGDAVVKKRPSKYFDSLQTIADQARKLYPGNRLPFISLFIEIRIVH